jgi:hypothetical protein
MMSSETQIIRLLRAQAQKAPEFGMAGMASPTFDAAPPDATPEACRRVRALPDFRAQVLPAKCCARRVFWSARGRVLHILLRYAQDVRRAR